ncbi:ABC transporter permease [Methanococcoides seepicolus]|uniref:ABC transporter permease n=1 Tax=Methanococcoides seepicolus TaxID=2828780 RepID=A0A9E4ZF01_9EURY|nr:ABC transporter permease [Methanococcoides seepicolus]MCM1985958.1 ABC transporter permease [Methanococcoides seepicolus]
MKGRNVFVIAQKEVADHLQDTGFLVLLAIYTIIIFSSTYMSGSFVHQESSMLLGSINVKMIAMFAPLIGIVLGFDAVVREQKSGSLNVLLTHPLFRDNIIAGKLLGSMLVLAAIIIFSVFVSIGTLLIFYGVEIGYTEIIRIFVFTILTFFYVSIFLGAAVLISTMVKDGTDSLTYNVVVWLFIGILFGAILKTAIAILTGDISNESVLITQLLNMAPIHHFAEAVVGRIDLGFGGFNSAGSVIGGIFDTEYTLTQCLIEFKMNIVVLVVTPAILFIIAFIAFLRKDITL